MLVVGLTGGIAAGKLTVARYFSQQDIPIIDADVIAKQVVEPGTPAYGAVVKAFGDVQGLLKEDGWLNREVLGRAVFGNHERLKTLNGIVHGAVRREILRRTLQCYIKGHCMVILDVPLLFESGLNYMCGLTVTVSIDGDLQKKRLLERNAELSEEDAEKRISSQMSMVERDARADHVVTNNGDLQDLHESLSVLLSGIRPSRVWTLLDLFPPFGILNALLTMLIRAIKYRGILHDKSLAKKD